MSGRGSAGGRENQPPSDKGEKKVKIKKENKWVEVDVSGEIKKGRFKYIKFTDDDGLETYLMTPE